MRWPSAYCAISRGASRSTMRASTQPTWPSASRMSHQSSIGGIIGFPRCAHPHEAPLALQHLHGFSVFYHAGLVVHSSHLIAQNSLRGGNIDNLARPAAAPPTSGEQQGRCQREQQQTISRSRLHGDQEQYSSRRSSVSVDGNILIVEGAETDREDHGKNSHWRTNSKHRGF